MLGQLDITAICNADMDDMDYIGYGQVLAYAAFHQGLGQPSFSHFFTASHHADGFSRDRYHSIFL